MQTYAREHDTLVLADEIYALINDPGNLRDDFTKVAATVYTNVSTPTQFAAVTAYEQNEEIEEYFRITREIHRIMRVMGKVPYSLELMKPIFPVNESSKNCNISVQQNN